MYTFSITVHNVTINSKMTYNDKQAAQAALSLVLGRLYSKAVLAYGAVK
jgi:hypothetical protein